MYVHIKRVFDVILSLICLILLWPFMLITALLVLCTSKGPVVFKQTRLGKDAKPFTMFKFRSMCVNAEHTGTGVYSFKGDSRLTPIGAFIRKTSLDELPQLINILKGDMSFIGPRPVLSYHPFPIEQYTTAQKERFKVRPGITGLAQIRGRKAVEWGNRLQYDAEYVHNLSFLMDVKVFFGTFGALFSRSGQENVAETATKKETASVMGDEK